MAGFGGEPSPSADLFSATFGDGQTVTGTLPDELRVTTRFGLFRIPTERLESVTRQETNLVFHLTNGDVLQGQPVENRATNIDTNRNIETNRAAKAFTLAAELGPEIDLLQAGLQHLQRKRSRQQTAWSKPENQVRSRLILQEAPAGPRGEFVLLLELQNLSEKTVQLVKPGVQKRVIPPGDINHQPGRNAWITARFEEPEARLQELREMVREPERVAIAPGGTYRLHFIIPYDIGGQRQLRKVEQKISALVEEQAPARERAHFFALDPMSAQPGTGHSGTLERQPRDPGTRGRVFGRTPREATIVSRLDGFGIRFTW